MPLRTEPLVQRSGAKPETMPWQVKSLSLRLTIVNDQ